jgi:2'-5' RNA ligase
MRLFTAIDLPPDIRAHLDSLIGQLRPHARISWSRAANLHITTKFIGEWPEAQLPELRTALDGVPRREPISIRIHGPRLFPSRRSPRVFLASVEAPGLPALARDLDLALEKLDVEPERRAYSPHLTLARIKEVKGLASFYKKVEELGDPEFGSYLADRFILYQSKPGAAGSVYTKLSEFPISTQ